MFSVHYEDGSVQTEETLKKWDNVSRDLKIKRVGIIFSAEREKQSDVFKVFPLPEHCDKYCCTKIGRLVVGVHNGRTIGYALMGRRGNIVYRIEVTAEGVHPLKILPAEELGIREGVWRDGC